jgi:Tfp pilus assembly protein PilP
MRKIILTSVIGISLLTLTSCSKEELVDCNKALEQYRAEVKHAGQNIQQISLIDQKYKEKYPSCGF